MAHQQILGYSVSALWWCERCYNKRVKIHMC